LATLPPMETPVNTVCDPGCRVGTPGCQVGYMDGYMGRSSIGVAYISGYIQIYVDLFRANPARILGGNPRGDGGGLHDPGAHLRDERADGGQDVRVLLRRLARGVVRKPRVGEALFTTLFLQSKQGSVDSQYVDDSRYGPCNQGAVHVTKLTPRGE
jgi:hypothetical protein